jgi:hypothetical protein
MDIQHDPPLRDIISKNNQKDLSIEVLKLQRLIRQP